MPKRKNKSAFIRSQGSELSAAQVVEKAKATGMVIAPGMVYAIRAAARKKSGNPVGPAAGRRVSTATASSQRADQDFVNLVASLGLIRIERLLSEFKGRLASI